MSDEPEDKFTIEFIGSGRSHAQAAGAGVMRDIKIAVYEQDVSHCWVTNFAEFLAELNSAMEAIPNEFRDRAMIELDMDYDCGSDITVWYERPQTEEELQAERQEIEQRQRAEQVRMEAREAAEYARLKAKFG